MTYMDFVYQPKIAAMLAEYINYITPVPGRPADHPEGRRGRDRADDKDVLHGAGDQPADLPDAERLRASCTATAC